MTTIAVNKEELAGDRQFTNTGTGYKWKGHTKIYQFDRPDIWHCPFAVGFAGIASDIIPIVDFFSNPDVKAPRVRGVSGIVLTAKKEIFAFDNYDKWLKVDQPFFAIGSGASYALGALSSGKTPTEAVKVAIVHDAYSGMGVRTIRFG